MKISDRISGYLVTNNQDNKMNYPKEFEEAATFIESVFEAEYQHGLACIELLNEAYAQSPIKWDEDEAEEKLQALRSQYLIVPRIKGVKLRPPFKIREPEDNRKARFQRRATAYRKRFFYKISLYESTQYGQAWRFLVPSVQDQEMTVSFRWDVVVHEGTMRLANIGQTVCQTCFGAAAVKNISCRCEEPGYLFPPRNDLGIVGSPTAIYRSDTRPIERYDEFIDGDC